MSIYVDLYQTNTKINNGSEVCHIAFQYYQTYPLEPLPHPGLQSKLSLNKQIVYHNGNSSSTSGYTSYTSISFHIYICESVGVNLLEYAHRQVRRRLTVFNVPCFLRLRMFCGAFEGADRSTWFRRCVGWLRCGQKSPHQLGT